MQYGYFDNHAREYVIVRPDTPAPWANYLGSPEYGALISGNAGGYSFVRSGAKGRILRYVFDGSDKPGRYIYLRDRENGDYWSASWMPVKKPLDKCRYDCRHGLGYSLFDSWYEGIFARAAYYVPEGSMHEVWMLKVKNESERRRTLTITGYAELTSNSSYEQDLINLQYSRFISSTVFHENRIMQRIHGNLMGTADRAGSDGNDLEERFFGMAGAKVSSYCGDKAAFLGNCHDYGDPAGVTGGMLDGTMNYNEYACGALSAEITLEPGQSACLAFLLGMKSDAEAAAIIRRYENTEEVCEGELNALRELWEERLAGLQVHTPDEDFNTMVNTWNAYNCYMTFIWSRAASFVYCGLRNGYGYRDTVQDIQGIIHLQPEMAVEKIRFMLSAQVHHGGGLPLVKFTHNPGHEDTPEDDSYVRETGHPAYRADDALWLFPTVYKYMAQSGNNAFLDEMIPYADRGSASVYDHLKKAIEFSLNHLGPHGMPAGLYADWNDCLRLGEQGESVFVAFQFYLAMKIMREFAALKKDAQYDAFLSEKMAALKQIIEKDCWQGDRFIRGFTQDGEVIGDKNAPEANMWLNPQSWSVISRVAGKEQGDIALQSAFERLNTAYGAVLMDPPYHQHYFEGALMAIYNPGTKENGGVFSQSQGWLILAEALNGNGNRAYTYYRENCPASQNDRIEIRHMEPYCFGQFTEGKDSPHFGRSHVHWLTGTASTVMVGCVEGILGIRPDLSGLRLSPAIPSAWGFLTMDYRFRGKKLHIEISNPSGAQSGVKELRLNGERLPDSYIPGERLSEQNLVQIVLG